MAKRRTKKQKASAKHIFIYQQRSVPILNTTSHVVKGQFNSNKAVVPKIDSVTKYANIQEKDMSLASIKKDLLRSLGIASFILALEMVLYLLGKFSLI